MNGIGVRVGHHFVRNVVVAVAASAEEEEEEEENHICHVHSPPNTIQRHIHMIKSIQVMIIWLANHRHQYQVTPDRPPIDPSKNHIYQTIDHPIIPATLITTTMVNDFITHSLRFHNLFLDWNALNVPIYAFRCVCLISLYKNQKMCSLCTSHMQTNFNRHHMIKLP